ncbi:hypothetical protein [Moraxella lacunata]|uniref:hypothetical protein n=1 Tax=Moraxella lacunata TaxID=477 RepID=UPI003EDEECAB
MARVPSVSVGSIEGLRRAISKPATPLAPINSKCLICKIHKDGFCRPFYCMVWTCIERQSFILNKF